MDDSSPNRMPPPQTESGSSSPPGPWNLWATLAFSLAIAVIYIAAATAVSVVYLFAGAVPPELAESDGLLFALGSLAAGAATVVAVAGFAALRKGVSVSQYLKLSPPRARDWVVWPILLLAFMLPLEWLRVGVFGQPAVPEVMVNLFRNCSLPAALWLAVLVGAPVSEEIFFRGFLFEGIRCSRLGAAGAVILCAAAWAVIHVQYGLVDMASIFFGGLFLGVARLRTGSLWIPMFLHFVWNCIAMVQTALAL